MAKAPKISIYSEEKISQIFMRIESSATVVVKTSLKNFLDKVDDNFSRAQRRAEINERKIPFSIITKILLFSINEKKRQIIIRSTSADAVSNDL